MPKTVCTSNTLAYLYNIETDVGFTHCYFPTMLFDEFIEKCLECKHSKDNSGFVYQSPKGCEIGMYFDKNCTIDAHIAKGTDMLIENKFVKEKYGAEKK